MWETNKIFHLAIPCQDLEATIDFYEKLGCKLVRKSHDKVAFNFFGNQLVCHLNPDKIDFEPKMYSRHYGLTFLDREDFNQVLANAEERNLLFFKDAMVHHQGKQGEHINFFLTDPSNNLLEFRYFPEGSLAY